MRFCPLCGVPQATLGLFVDETGPRDAILSPSCKKIFSRDLLSTRYKKTLAMSIKSGVCDNVKNSMKKNETTETTEFPSARSKGEVLRVLCG